MKKLKLKITPSDRKVLYHLLTDFDINNALQSQSLKDYRHVGLLILPIRSVISKLTLPNTQYLTIDITQASAINTITNTLNIDEYISILHIIGQIERYVINTISGSITSISYHIHN